MAEIGIDLGTTFSVVAYMRNQPEVIENQGSRITASAVASFNGEITVGNSAKNMMMVQGARVLVGAKRDMGTDKTYELGGQKLTPQQVGSLVLKELVRAAEERLGEKVAKAIITIPARFGAAAAEATLEAARLAGIPNAELLQEPTAAAIAFGAEEETVLVYDLGGGTFDVAIIDMYHQEVLGTAGDENLGGLDFDQLLARRLQEEVKKKFSVDIMADETARNSVLFQCEKAKVDLSTMKQAMVTFMGMVEGKLINHVMMVTRAQFEELIAEPIKRTIGKIDEAIANARKKDETFTKERIEIVLLVGGSTYIPVVREKVAEYFGFPPQSKVNPDLAVALGAAKRLVTTAKPANQHFLRVPGVPLRTPSTTLKLRGRTSPGSAIAVAGGLNPRQVQADDSGQFQIEVELRAGHNNELVVRAQSPGGEEATFSCVVLHQADSEEVKLAPVDGIKANLPRSLGIRLTGQDDLLSIVIPGQTVLPAVVTRDGYGVQAAQPGAPGKCLIHLYEGELPYSPLNRLLGTLELETPPTGNTREPVEVTFEVNEQLRLTASARMVNYPDRHVKRSLEIKPTAIREENVLDRVERLFTKLGKEIPPVTDAKLRKLSQGLKDLCAEFAKDPTPERYAQIKNTGTQLRNEVETLEASVV